MVCSSQGSPPFTTDPELPFKWSRNGYKKTLPVTCKPQALQETLPSYRLLRARERPLLIISLERAGQEVRHTSPWPCHWSPHLVLVSVPKPAATHSIHCEGLYWKALLSFHWPSFSQGGMGSPLFPDPARWRVNLRDCSRGLVWGGIFFFLWTLSAFSLFILGHMLAEKKGSWICDPNFIKLLCTHFLPFLGLRF